MFRFNVKNRLNSSLSSVINISQMTSTHPTYTTRTYNLNPRIVVPNVNNNANSIIFPIHDSATKINDPEAIHLLDSPDIDPNRNCTIDNIATSTMHKNKPCSIFNHHLHNKHHIFTEIQAPLLGTRVRDSQRTFGVRYLSSSPAVIVPATQLTGFWKDLSECAPVEFVQDTFIQFHNVTHLPWWATIVLSTIIVRGMLTMPLFLYQQCILARLENLGKEMQELVKELQKETAVAIKMFKWTENQAKLVYNRSLKKQWNKLIVRDNCHPAKTFILMWVQFPLWIIVSAALRNVCYMLPYGDPNAQAIYIEMMSGGFGWIPNLVVPDQHWILPIALGVISLINIEVQNMTRIRDPTKLQKILVNLGRVVSVVLIPISCYVPSALCLYWVTSSGCAFVQNLIVISPKMRRFCRIPLTESERKNPYRHLGNQLMKKLSLRSKAESSTKS